MWELPLETNRAGYPENETHRQCSNCGNIFLKRVPQYSSHRAMCPACRSLNDKKRPTEKRMLSRAKERSTKLGLPFDIELDDIVIPDICPVLGRKIEVNSGTIGPNSPTLDRINNELGYVKGNVWVICNLANSMKNAASFSDLHKFADWVKAEIPLDKPDPL